MCTRANKASVPDSLHALAGSFAALVVALTSLVVALASAPTRLMVPRPTKHGKAAVNRACRGADPSRRRQASG